MGRIPILLLASTLAVLAGRPCVFAQVPDRARLPHVVSESEPVDGEPVPPVRIAVPWGLEGLGIETWWHRSTAQPLRESPAPILIDVNSLLMDTLRHSAHVRAISDNAVIAETAITRAAADFDFRTFFETKMVRTSVPTGSTLEAGFNVPRLREEDWYFRSGLRQKNSYGGRFEASQQIGTRNSNSTFFFPSNQGNSRLTLSYNQPLLNGRGQAYNRSLVLLAAIDTQVVKNSTVTELQDRLLEVTEAMWELYVQRSLLLQKQRHLARAETILTRLEKRAVVDSLTSQILRARAAVALRNTELIRAQTAILNGESRLRALVNSPEMLASRASELIPSQTPLHSFVQVSLENALITAFENRVEIDSASREMEAARVRLNVARNELLPVLDVVLETYVMGLRGNYDIGQSWADQFGVGEPSYTAGLVFEAPARRRAAQANHFRRQAELRQLSSRLQATIETLHAEVEIAVREVETSYREMEAKYQSLQAAESDAEYLQRRWESLPGDDRAASFLLEDLLDAQDRLAAAEFAFARAEVTYTISLARLNRATGTLLIHEPVVLVPSVDSYLADPVTP